MPIPNLPEILSTTTPTISSMVSWLEPLLVLVLGIAVGATAIMVIYNGVVKGISYLMGNRKNYDD